MTEIRMAVEAAPQVGDRVRWNWPSGTNFGRVVSIAEQGDTAIVQIEDATLEVAVPAASLAVLSAPSGGAR